MIEVREVREGIENFQIVSIDPDKLERAMSEEGYDPEGYLEYIYDVYGFEDGQDFQTGNDPLELMFYSDIPKSKLNKIKKDLGASITEGDDFDKFVDNNYDELIGNYMNDAGKGFDDQIDPDEFDQYARGAYGDYKDKNTAQYESYEDDADEEWDFDSRAGEMIDDLNLYCNGDDSLRIEEISTDEYETVIEVYTADTYEYVGQWELDLDMYDNENYITGIAAEIDAAVSGLE